MSLETGTKLGPYEITGAVGAGGMGEVYRARDTRLGRDVAIKVLPENFAKDAVLKERFEREARTISSLNHPNICTLYDVGHQDGTDYLVMELLEGESLAQRLAKGALPVAETLRIGAEMSDALERAHRQGIVHRDLKPGNIVLTKSGAKLLDFGLAKPQGLAASGSAFSAVATQASPASPVTREGTVIGTFQYMSPEQVEGREADSRSDIFALGAVLYEMATGKRAFEGKSQISIASAILEKEPEPISRVQPMTPPALEHVVKTCLAKDPEERFQTAHDVKLELKWISESGSQAAALPVVSRRRLRERTAWALVALAGILAAGFAATWFRRAVEEPPVLRLTLPGPPKADLNVGGGMLAISPDGHYVVFPATAQGKTLLWLRSLDSTEARSLEGTEGASYPFWSPDSRFIGFFAQSKLKKVDVSGSPPQVICDVTDTRGGTWNREGVILFAPDFNSGLMRVSAQGGQPQPVTSPDASRKEISHRWPYFLPDGKHYLFTMRSSQPETRGIYVGSLDSAERKRLAGDDSKAVYSEAGYLLFWRTPDVLLAQRLDLKRLELTGEPVFLASGLQDFDDRAYAPFSVSQTGLLVYYRLGASNVRLSWFDRGGKRLSDVGPPEAFYEFALSPDESLLISNRSDADLWMIEFARGTLTRFTFDPAWDGSPIWSPDGKSIVFGSLRGGHYDLYQKVASGAGSDELLLKSEENKYPDDWSRDGRYILFERISSATKSDLWALAMTGERKPFPVTQTPFNEFRAQFSPDGHWFAYVSDESGGTEVYAQSFPPSGAKFQVSTGGGDQPQWRRDGGELYYTAQDGKLMAVEVKTSPAFSADIPKPLFDARITSSGLSGRNLYVASHDGRRFLILTRDQGDATASSSISVVVNWAGAIKK
jgi:Tol biopolymer transport system component